MEHSPKRSARRDLQSEGSLESAYLKEHPLAARAANEARMRGKPQKRMKQKKKPLGTFAAGTPTITPKEFYKAMPRPASAMGYPARPTQLDMREARAHAATMAINDGLNASMPLDQRKMLMSNMQPRAKDGPLYSKFKNM